MKNIEVLVHEPDETCTWFDVDINTWRTGTLLSHRIFYDFEQVFVVSYWNEEKEQTEYTAVKRSELRIQM